MTTRVRFRRCVWSLRPAAGIAGANSCGTSVRPRARSSDDSAAEYRSSESHACSGILVTPRAGVVTA
jgi:hypothetical protein